MTILLLILSLLAFLPSSSNSLSTWKKASIRSEKQIGFSEDSPAKEEQVIPETPPFLLRIYDNMSKENEGQITVHSLRTVHTEGDNDTREFYVLPSLVAGHEIVQKAEIYISTQSLEDLPKNESLTVSIYETSSDKKVSSRPLSSQLTGWLSLPVTKMMQRGILRADRPLRFRIFVERNDGTNATRILQWNHPIPWLVIYSDEVNNQVPFPVTQEDAISERQIKGFSDRRPKRQIGPEANTSQEAVGCRKMDMIVNTTTLGWSGWLVRPKIFNAYQCEGKCSKSRQEGSIYHANLKALVHQKQGNTDVNKPCCRERGCCIPTKLRSIPFIYRLENGGFVLRLFNDMVVEECACY